MVEPTLYAATMKRIDVLIFAVRFGDAAEQSNAWQAVEVNVAKLAGR